MPLLLEGAIKVVREDEAKGELLLYYLEQGQTCTMSIACCLGNKKVKYGRTYHQLPERQSNTQG